MRTLILSDIHLGLPDFPLSRLARSARTLEPLLEAADCVILNGDTADIHQPRLKDRALELYRELESMAERKGVQLLTVCGNHDVGLSPLTHVELESGAVLVTHGHAFSERMLPWVPASAEMNRVFRSAAEQYPKTVAGAVRSANDAAMVQWSDERSLEEPTALLAIGTQPMRVLSVLRWWREYPCDAARFAQRYSPATRFVVCGHSHRAGAWKIGAVGDASRRVILNTGSFGFPSRPAAAIVTSTSEGSEIELRRISVRSGRYSLAPRSAPSSWRIH
ncbi:MAG: hypothetical protein EXS03_05405 [Phycisphaerales bacterium]|nr:hypothetical protein [Phycisphaerales bacterium]